MKKNANILIGLGSFVVTLTLFYLFTKDKNKVNVVKNKGNINTTDKETSILFIGDSNTVSSYSYADQLKKMFPNLKIKKIAKVGEKTDWMKTQLTNELKNNKYDVVAILSGSNDIYALGKIDSTKKNLDAMYKMIHDSGAKVLAVTPPNKDFYTKKTEQKQKLLYDLIDWMKNNKNIDNLVDFHKITSDKKYFSSGDGYLHANSSAHKILAEQTKQKLKLS